MLLEGELAPDRLAGVELAGAPGVREGGDDADAAAVFVCVVCQAAAGEVAVSVADVDDEAAVGAP